MSKLIYLAAACGVSLVVWGVAFSRQAPPRAQPATESKYLSLQDRWEQGEWNEAVDPPLPKGPRLVQTVKVVPAPVEAAEIKSLTPPEQPIEKSYRPKKVKHADICSKHHLRKVMVGKYKWRCLK